MNTKLFRGFWDLLAQYAYASREMRLKDPASPPSQKFAGLGFGKGVSFEFESFPELLLASSSASLPPSFASPDFDTTETFTSAIKRSTPAPPATA